MRQWYVPGHKLLLKLHQADDYLNKQLEEDSVLKKAGFKVAVDVDMLKRHQAAMDIGTVVQIGRMAWRDPDLGYGLPGWEPWCKVGDEVVIAKYCGKFVNHPDKGSILNEDNFYVINDVDVQMVIPRGE